MDWSYVIYWTGVFANNQQHSLSHSNVCQYNISTLISSASISINIMINSFQATDDGVTSAYSCQMNYVIYLLSWTGDQSNDSNGYHARLTRECVYTNTVVVPVSLVICPSVRRSIHMKGNVMGIRLLFKWLLCCTTSFVHAIYRVKQVNTHVTFHGMRVPGEMLYHWCQPCTSGPH